MLDVGGVLTFRCELYLHAGDLGSAEVDARTLNEIADVCGWPMGAGFAAAWLGEVLVDRGELEEAERMLTESPFAAPARELPQSTRTPGCCRLAGGSGSRSTGRRRRSRISARPGGATRRSARSARRRAVALAARLRPDRSRPARRGRAARGRGARSRAAGGRAAGDRYRAARRGAAGRRDPAAARGGQRARGLPRRSSSAPARTPTSDLRSIVRATPRTPAARCAARSTSRTAAAPTRSRTMRSPSCGRPARARAGA